jgi:hypothetical protein
MIWRRMGYHYLQAVRFNPFLPTISQRLRYRLPRRSIPELGNENESSWDPPGNSNSNSSGFGISRCLRQSSDSVALRFEHAALLLPLRARKRHEALHEDVRPSAIRKALVGELLPQENRRRKAIGGSRLEFRLEEDESQRTGKPVRKIITEQTASPLFQASGKPARAGFGSTAIYNDIGSVKRHS